MSAQSKTNKQTTAAKTASGSTALRKPQASAPAVGNLTCTNRCVFTLARSSDAPPPRVSLCVSGHVMQGCVHDYLPFKPQNKPQSVADGELELKAEYF